MFSMKKSFLLAVSIIAFNACGVEDVAGDRIRALQASVTAIGVQLENEGVDEGPRLDTHFLVSDVARYAAAGRWEDINMRIRDFMNPTDTVSERALPIYVEMMDMLRVANPELFFTKLMPYQVVVAEVIHDPVLKVFGHGYTGDISTDDGMNEFMAASEIQGIARGLMRGLRGASFQRFVRMMDSPTIDDAVKNAEFTKEFARWLNANLRDAERATYMPYIERLLGVGGAGAGDDLGAAAARAVEIAPPVLGENLTPDELTVGLLFSEIYDGGDGYVESGTTWDIMESAFGQIRGDGNGDWLRGAGNRFRKLSVGGPILVSDDNRAAGQLFQGLSAEYNGFYALSYETVGLAIPRKLFLVARRGV
jgi:hypothetical protein